MKLIIKSLIKLRNNIIKVEESDIIEQFENENLFFFINENLIKIINDESLKEDILFSKIISEINISSKNHDDIGLYIYFHFLFRNSFSLFFGNGINNNQDNRPISDYLDDKITSFNFGKFMLYIKDEKILLDNIKNFKENKNKNGLLFEFVNKDIDENDINPDLSYEKIDENIINY